MNPVPSTVLIIERHPLMREALYTAISEEPDLRIGMKAASAAEALQLLKVSLPDIVLFAMGNPRNDELEMLKMLAQLLPETPILAFIANEMEGQEQAVLDAGVSAVLSKVATRSELITTLREIRLKVSKNNERDHLGEEANQGKISTST